MMSMSASSVSLIACAALAIGGFYMMNSSNKGAADAAKAAQEKVAADARAAQASKSEGGPGQGPGQASTGGVGAINPGMYTISSGGMSMIINPDNCTDTSVGINDATGDDRQAWNLSPVPGRPGYYYIQSEHRLFKKSCNLAYLTAPSDCSGVGATLDTPQWADRQYWQLVPTGNGSYQVQNAACAAKRAPSYLMSSGVTKGMNVLSLSSRSGTPYTFNAIAS